MGRRARTYLAWDSQEGRGKMQGREEGKDIFLYLSYPYDHCIFPSRFGMDSFYSSNEFQACRCQGLSSQSASIFSHNILKRKKSS
jgi:hypothetical protein